MSEELKRVRELNKQFEERLKFKSYVENLGGVLIVRTRPPKRRENMSEYEIPNAHSLINQRRAEALEKEEARRLYEQRRQDYLKRNFTKYLVLKLKNTDRYPFEMLVSDLRPECNTFPYCEMTPTSRRELKTVFAEKGWKITWKPSVWRPKEKLYSRIEVDVLPEV